MHLIMIYSKGLNSFVKQNKIGHSGFDLELPDIRIWPSLHYRFCFSSKLQQKLDLVVLKKFVRPLT